ncbi:alpha/beta hydrolase [Rhodococcus sp. IEGM 1370]|uniref:alpha/beta fold hydrolase n=1 Tax=unclassified Rhodococcus (in: high G+C Gram-positive bacteria) TaxID=192944 RepID=UPI0011F06F40|nr:MULTISPECIES: alpha/beta hydrolase [unclassified Rhodococcus (in: high G+C Gram-positive bacteria)]KAA0922506.1 alpha/beta hydrolase [Rhodococcus sp. ANT_H53B]MDV8078204.1 alpha/beta hydrolase [Rhodococcus sp. IEGM 1370]
MTKPKLTTLLATAGLTVGSMVGIGVAPAAAQELPTVVLVHGAFADNTSWDGVADNLRGRGYPVVTADNSLRGPAFDAASVTDVVESIDGPVVLVGHSYGGTVISNVHADNVEALVYVASFMPVEGEPVALELDPIRFPVTALVPPVIGLSIVDDSSNLIGKNVDSYITPALFRPFFAPDVTEEQAARMVAHQKTIAAGALLEPSGPPSWADTPSWALIPQQDQIIPASAERFMAQRAGARVTEVPGSHAILVSNPAAVADLVAEADAGS